jgi:hypothetical protein
MAARVPSLRIDEALKKEFGNKAEIWVNLLPGMTRRLRQTIIARYEQAGWTVRYESDQRDGEALVFSATPR